VTDPVFGPAIVFGAGGIAIEVLHDRAVALPPLSLSLVEEMIRGTRVAAMLTQFRNLPPVDREALEAVLLRVSEMAVEMPEIAELDINPLVADENGVLALDARIAVREPPAGAGPHAHLAICPYPADLATEATLPDGARVMLRPIRPEDAELETDFIAALSPETRRLRFQSALRSLTPAMLARFTQIDYDREMALVAIAPAEGREREVGVARYVRMPDGRTCEYAIVLADAWQARGLGRVMMSRLIEVARDRGLATMIGEVLASNEAMLRLCRELGFVATRDPDDPLMRRLSLELAAHRIPA
jgi:acetyltransferase